MTTTAGSATTSPSDVEAHLRELAPEVLGSLVRRYRDFDACDDAVQEALMAAAARWPVDGLPGNPKGWLVTVATRRLIESWRSDAARRRREEVAASLAPEPDPTPGADDTLTLLFLCCHPALTPASQVALTLRAVGGLTTAEIARALLVPEATVGQRISRAKQAIRASGVGFRMPDAEDHRSRLSAVLRVLYLIFNEGYAATSGPSLVRADLSAEATRLARQLHERLPADGEVAGLLALMLLTDARRPARTGPDGSLIPLDEQDRSLWDADAIAEGTALIEHALAETPIGPYQLQAAIAAIHDEAPSAGATDWRQVAALYEWLERLAPGPMVTLNRIVALAMVVGPKAGLERLAEVETDPGMRGHQRTISVRAHLLEMAGDPGAAAAYRDAARRTRNLPERRYLEARAVRLEPGRRSSRIGTTSSRTGGSMPLRGDYAPGTSGWARRQAETFEGSGGTKAATLGGRPIVVVTSVGARSGSLRKTALMRVEHDGRYLAVASNGGARRDPDWVRNLRANPHVEVQDGRARRGYTAREPQGDERETWWARAVEAYPTYATFQARTKRLIPVFVLEPRD